MTKTTLATMFLMVVGCANEPATDGHGLEGTYDFVLDSSDVAPKLRETCAGDAKCWQDIQAEAANEKVRFTRTASGGLLYTSFEIEGGKEKVHFEAPADLARVERRSDGTIAISDPRKGRLVYRRAS